MRISRKMLGVAALLSLAAAPLLAQAEIKVDLLNFYNRAHLGPVGGMPYTYASTADNPVNGVVVASMQPVSWMEWQVNCTTPGLYKINMQVAQNQDPATVFAFEVRRLSSYNDPFATHYSTGDSKDYGQMGSSYWDWQELGDIVDADGNLLTVPLYEGVNIFREQNVSGRHNPAFNYPTDLCDPNNRAWNPFWGNTRTGRITLIRVGDLPEYRTITGKVTGDRPAGIGVKRALVMAAPTGQSALEPSHFWKKGYFTQTQDDGSYVLSVPTGSWEIKSGRPSGYNVEGSTVQALPASGAATANMSLVNLFHDDGTGTLVACVQNEYFEEYGGEGVSLLNVDGQNGYKVGWIAVGDSTSMMVDAPVAGLYQMTSSYFNGDVTGTLRISTDLGSATTAQQPGTGNWGLRTEVTYPNLIYLVQGPNLVKQELISGASDFDGLTFRLTNEVPKVGQVKGTVKDILTGAPVAGATITLGTNVITTKTDGTYSIIANEGSNQVVTCAAAYVDGTASQVVDVVAGGVVVADFNLVVRPHVNLTTANGYSWKWIGNTGGTADYSAEAFDDSAWQTITVPSSWENIINENDTYGWYRLHFDAPANFLGLLPNRLIRVYFPGVDDCDVTWLNGTQIGATGKMPNPPIGPQPSGHVNETQPYEIVPGSQPEWATPRYYYFPASLLKPTGNVLAVKVWDMNFGAGITTTPVLEVAPATGTVTGTVKAGGTPVAGFRVTAMNENGVSTDTALTDASGAFELKHVYAGPTIIGAVKYGYQPIVQPVGNIVEGGAVNGLELNATAVAGGAAPVYDDFNGSGTAWEAKWTAQSLLSPDPINAPTITLPGVDAATRAEIPGSITIDGGLMARATLLSKATLNKYASLVSAKLVSALPSSPEPTGTIPNVILYISGQTQADGTPLPADQWSFVNQVELDLEGYVTTGGVQRVRVMIWMSTAGDNRTIYPIDMALERLNDVSPSNPVELAIAKTGSFYDFYINGIHSFSGFGNIMPDYRFGLYSYPTASTTTWDEVRASGLSVTTPVPGDLSGNGIIDATDTLIALRIAGGLTTATPAQVTAGNVAGGDGKITILDALRLQQAANGRPL